MAACPEEIRLGAVEDHGDVNVLVRPVDVAELEAQSTGRMRVAFDRPEDVAADAERALVPGELTRLQRRCRPAREAGVEQKNGERGCHGKRDHEPHRIPPPLHAAEFTAGSPAATRPSRLPSVSRPPSVWASRARAG